MHSTSGNHRQPAVMFLIASRILSGDSSYFLTYPRAHLGGLFLITNDAVKLVSPNVPSETTPSSCMLGYLIRVSCVAAKVFGDELSCVICMFY